MRDERQKADETEVADWLKRCLTDGDAQYWGRIFERYKRPIFVLCHRMLRNEEDAKDLTSDVFMKAFENLRTFDLARPFFPWLYRIAANLCIDFIRKNGKVRFTADRELETFRNEEESIDEEKSRRLQMKVKKAIDGLKRPQRTCFCLFYLHEKSYEEITQITHYTYDEVRSHIQNGRRKFRLAVNTQASSRG